MRNFLTLDQVTDDSASGIIIFQAEKRNSSLAMKREGAYVAISANHGPIEIALRPRLEDLSRALSRLQRVQGLQTTRQVGTGEWNLSLGLQLDGSLLVRPSMIADATGNISFNFALTDAMRERLFQWLNLTQK